jgi:hypothetical protein
MPVSQLTVHSSTPRTAIALTEATEDLGGSSESSVASVRAILFESRSGIHNQSAKTVSYSRKDAERPGGALRVFASPGETIFRRS